MADIPANVDPAVRFLLEQLPRHSGYKGPKVYWRVEAGAGLGHDTVRMWLYRSRVQGPKIKHVRAALNELGYDLDVVPLRGRSDV
jgi:hypothetical protein